MYSVFDLAPPSTEELPSRKKLGLLAGYVWLFILGISFLFFAYHVFQNVIRVQEYAYSCDPFGYLSMARAIRKSAHKLRLPRFELESQQTRLLLDFMQSHHLPPSSYDQVVAPHAYHYFPGTGRVGVQYPPGTGLFLALFPEGRAVARLNKAVILLLVISGLAALIAAAARQAWMGAGFVILALCCGLRILNGIGTLSFSINASLPMVLLSLLSLWAALVLGEKSSGHFGLSWFLLSGMAFGFTVLIRLATVLLAPGFLLLLWRKPRTHFLRRMLYFGFGAVLCGILPVLAFQDQETGAWYHSTYAVPDTAAPTLAAARLNFAFYLGHGPGSTYKWILLVSLMGLVALILGQARKDVTICSELTWKRFTLAALLLWSIPTAYFLTHSVAIPYYSIPGTFGAIFLLAMAAFTVDCSRKSSEPRAHRPAPLHKLQSVALAVALIPGIVTLKDAAQPLLRLSGSLPQSERHHFSMPAELASKRAWIWADYLSGTFWYYGHRPAFKIGSADAPTRALIYRFVFERGEPQYLVQDSPYMPPIMREIVGLGGTLERRPGVVDGSPYFLINWPTSGPATRSNAH